MKESLVLREWLAEQVKVVQETLDLQESEIGADAMQDADIGAKIPFTPRRMTADEKKIVHREPRGGGIDPLD